MGPCGLGLGLPRVIHCKGAKGAEKRVLERLRQGVCKGAIKVIDYRVFTRVHAYVLGYNRLQEVA